MPMKAVVLVNCNAGKSSLSESALSDIVRPILIANGIEAEFCGVSPEELHTVAEAALKRDITLVIAAGGDGTVSSVASVLVGKNATLGVLPLGTLNHFAKDLSLPMDLAGATEVIAQGNVRQVDVGEVNGRTFINNCSLGIYSHVATERDRLRKKWKIGKWLAMGLAACKILGHFPMVSVRLEADEKARTRKTPVVFVGNNEYQFDKLRVGIRESLSNGQLSLYVANTQSRWGFLQMSVRACFGRLLDAEDLEASKHTELWITSRRRTLLVAMDGEVTRMQPPLHYRILPSSLRVCVPMSPDR